MTEQTTDPDQPRTGHELKSRAEHLAWCKQRAIAELDADPSLRGIQSALASMTSDTGKHPETAGHPGNDLGFLELMGGFMNTAAQMRRHIEGYN